METTDEIIDSEHSPTNFPQPLFQPITPPIPDEPYPSTSSYTDATSIPLSSNEPDAPSPITGDQLEHDLDNFITNQQEIHDTIFSLSFNFRISSTPSIHIAPTRVQRTFTKCYHRRSR